MSNIFCSSILYFSSLVILSCSPLPYFTLSKWFIATPRGSVMLDCGFSTLMSSLSDKHETRGCVVPLDLHFGWDAQLNTSEMFWIDISRWMLCNTCRWILVYLPWHPAHAFEPLPFFCSIVSIAV